MYIYIYIWLSTEAEGHFFLSETPLLLFCKTFASKKQRKYYDFFICHEYFKFNYLKLLYIIYNIVLLIYITKISFKFKDKKT